MVIALSTDDFCKFFALWETPPLAVSDLLEYPTFPPFLAFVEEYPLE